MASIPTSAILKNDLFFKSEHYGNIEKLAANNYPAWSSAMTIHLEASELLDIVKGDNPHPPRDASDEAKRLYRVDEPKTRAALLGSCTPSIRAYIASIDLPFNMWEILRTRLDSAASAAGRLALRQSFEDLKPSSPDAPISEFISAMENIQNQLAGTQQAIDDEGFISQLLRRLPEKYAMEVTILNMKEDRTQEYVLRTIQNAEIRKQLAESQSTSSNTAKTSGDALAASSSTANTADALTASSNRNYSYRGRSSYRGGRTNRGKYRSLSSPYGNSLISQNIGNSNRVTCYNCGKNGHLARDCLLMECFACGANGHGAGQCPLASQQKTPEQEQKGLEAWNRFQQKRGATAAVAQEEREHVAAK